MSTAFVREEDGVESVEALPERPLSPYPNFVTAEGLAQIELELARQQDVWTAAEAAGDRAALAAIARDLNYWVARRATAQVVAVPPDARRVQFGSTMVIQRPDGGRQSCRIVGEDEAEPAQGLLSFVSPLAQALVGREPGDVVQLGDSEIRIVSIGQSD
jgi:transcription elongation GreA/GreB family factor